MPFRVAKIKTCSGTLLSGIRATSHDAKEGGVGNSGTASMVNVTGDQKHTASPDPDRASDPPPPPSIRIVDWHGLTTMVANVFGEDAKDQFERAADKIGTSVVFDPLAPPQYQGLVKDGNPITFLVKHYRLKIESQSYYQADLCRDNEKLFHALRNLFKNRNWLEDVESADAELLDEDLPPFVLGKRVKLATKLCDILPARRNIDSKPVQSAPAWNSD